MSSAILANSAKSSPKDEDLQKLLADAAKEINLPDMYSARPPRLMINYQRNLTGIPEGAWVYRQKMDENGKIVDPGTLVENPTTILFAARYQYVHYSNELKRYYRSPMFKQFGHFIKAYKQNLIIEVKEQTRKIITEDDLRIDQIVYALVKIGDEWKPCYIPNFHGTNYMVLQNYLKTFIGVPYCAYYTHLSNTVAVRSGGTLYYKIESLVRGEKISDVEFLTKLIDDARDLNMALDTRAMGSEEQSADQASRQAGKLPPADDGARNGNGISDEEVPF